MSSSITARCKGVCLESSQDVNHPVLPELTLQHSVHRYPHHSPKDTAPLLDLHSPLHSVRPYCCLDSAEVLLCVLHPVPSKKSRARYLSSSSVQSVSTSSNPSIISLRLSRSSSWAALRKRALRRPSSVAAATSEIDSTKKDRVTDSLQNTFMALAQCPHQVAWSLKMMFLLTPWRKLRWLVEYADQRTQEICYGATWWYSGTRLWLATH